MDLCKCLCVRMYTEQCCTVMSCACWMAFARWELWLCTCMCEVAGMLSSIIQHTLFSAISNPGME